VVAGQFLGNMGRWGADPDPWLHFELRYEHEGARAARALDTVKLDGRRFDEYVAGSRSDGAP
jgi:murein DD-endopeptidase MepM/ murein hydrolase activator NlpD